MEKTNNCPSSSQEHDILDIQAFLASIPQEELDDVMDDFKKVSENSESQASINTFPTQDARHNEKRQEGSLEEQKEKSGGNRDHEGGLTIVVIPTHQPTTSKNSLSTSTVLSKSQEREVESAMQDANEFMNLSAEGDDECWDNVRNKTCFGSSSLKIDVDNSDCSNDLVFQYIDLHHVVYNEQQCPNKIPGNPSPVIRMFGITQQGSSICCNVHGFLPYIYAAPPSSSSLILESNDIFIRVISAQLNSILQNKYYKDNQKYRVLQPIIAVEICERKSIMGYFSERSHKFLKITFAYPMLVHQLKKVLESGRVQCTVFKVYESNVAYLDRFLVDHNLGGCNWVRCKEGTYRVRKSDDKKDLAKNLDPSSSSCLIEIDVDDDGTSIIPIPNTQELSNEIASGMKILSFDIECAGRPGIFPQPEMDPVIQISLIVVKAAPKNEEEGIPIFKGILTLGTCAPIQGVTVRSFQNETQLLKAWSNMVVEIDPDIITGFNIKGFDLWYILQRAKQLGIIEHVNRIGRIRSEPIFMREKLFTSKQMGNFQTKEYSLSGRVILDVFEVIKKEHKLRSYSLNAISAHFLGDQKEDVPYSMITELFHGNEQTRKRLAEYCVKDADLPIKLLQKLMILINLIEMSKVTGVTLTGLLTRGQQVKVFSQILRKARAHGYVIPVNFKAQRDLKKNKGNDDEQDKNGNKEGEEKEEEEEEEEEEDNVVGYEGATVIEPIKGYYDTPIATLDFASLYPSIIIAHNLCYTTLITNNQLVNTLGIDNLTCSPDTSSKQPTYFVKSNIKKGLLPIILEELLEARKVAKRDLKRETDPFKKKVLDGKQLALKITANSVYGFTGAAEIGILPCVKISKAVTAFGRDMIESTKRTVEEMYTIENGFAHDAKVVYGDTDSVMVRFGVQTIEDAIALGQEAAEHVSKKFKSPIRLEFEKVYCPYLLISKKKYAGLYFTRPDKYDKLDCKGLEIVRRDNCRLVGEVMDQCLKIMMIQRDPNGALAYAKTVISNLLQDKIDLSLLVISKELKSLDGKQNNQAHVAVAKKKLKRDPGSAPKLGERVPYVIINNGNKKAKLFEKAEDPLYVLENHLVIDAEYYLVKQLVQPLTRIFDSYFGDKISIELQKGSHTLKRCMPSFHENQQHPSSSSSSSSTMTAFIKRVDACLGCRARLEVYNKSDTTNALCKHCVPKMTSLYLEQLDKVSEVQRNHQKYWSQCQRCQGSLHQKVICNNYDCPIFYSRTKAVIDLEKETQRLARF